MPLGAFAPCPLPLGGTATDGLVAEQHARICADLKSAVAAAPFAIVRALTTTGTIQAYLGQHGVGLNAAPTITKNGMGDITLMWEPSYLDEYDNAWPVYIKHAIVTAHEGALFTAGSMATVQLVDSRTLRIRANHPVSGVVEALLSVVVW